MAKSKAPPAPETKPEVDETLPPAIDPALAGGADDVGSTPPLDDESLDSDAPPAADGEKELDETGENPSLDDDDAPETEDAGDDDSELEPIGSKDEDEYGEDAPNENEPNVPTLEEYLEAGYSEKSYKLRFGRNPTPNTPRAKPVAPAAIPTRSSRRGKPSPKLAHVVWAHGPLQRDGVLHEPGSTVHMTEDEGKALECVSLRAELDDEPEGDEGDA